MKVLMHYRRNTPTTVGGESVTITTICSSFDKAEIDELEENLPKGFVLLSTTQNNVIRCKDCKYGEPSALPSKVRWCSIHEFYREPDWFCSDGKMKGD